MTITSKGDIFILRIKENIIEVIFDHWEKNNGNGTYFFDNKANRYNIKNCI
jgi:hypothetical protein